MKKVLYLTNIEVPYRVVFFNDLAKHCDLTVVYERSRSTNRDEKWSNSVDRKYNIQYLDGIKIGNEFSFSTRIINILSKKWDCVIVGCYNSPIQIIAMAIMKLKRIPFAINLDGEPFLSKNWKTKIKTSILKSASAYLVAGEKATESLKNIIHKDIEVYPYYFSSLKKSELENNASSSESRNNTVLVIGQYFDYKGMDIALKAAKLDNSIHYKFIGMGKRTDLFIQEQGPIPENVEIIPFLDKSALEQEYKKCALMVLPTRQECWGLVVNEAASFGTPIVSTWGSGAAMEFLSEKYSQYLAIPNNTESLLNCIKECLNASNKSYSDYLRKKSCNYSIENSVKVHLDLIESS